MKGIFGKDLVELGGFGETGRNGEKASGNFEHIFGFKRIRKIIGYCENLYGNNLKNYLLCVKIERA